VVKLLSKTWWMPVGVRLEGPQLEPEGPRAEMGRTTWGFPAFNSFCLTVVAFK